MHHLRSLTSYPPLFKGVSEAAEHPLLDHEDETRLFLQSVHPRQIPATTHVIALAVDLARQRGYSINSLLQNCYLTEERLHSPSVCITREQELKVFENLLELSDGAPVGLEIGQRLHVSCFGLAGYTMLVSETVRDAIDCMSTFPLLMGLYFSVTTRDEVDKTVIIIDDYSYSKHLEELCTDMLLAAIIAIIGDLVGQPVKPLSISLKRDYRSNNSFRAQLFGCNVTFGAAENAVAFPTSLLSERGPLANAVSGETCYEQCVRMERDWNAKASRDLISQMNELLTRDLNEFNKLGRVAKHFCLTERTLRRRLKSIDISFQQLLDDVRQKQAKKLLLDGAKIAHVAESLGYSDTASFRHAFRRWTGLSPSQYRQQPVS